MIPVDEIPNSLGTISVNAHARIFGSSFRVNKFLTDESLLVITKFIYNTFTRKYSRISRDTYINKYCIPKFII